MANPRRISHVNNNNNPQNPETQSMNLTTIFNLLKKPQAFPLLLTVFILLTWVSLRFQHSSHFSSLPNIPQKWSRKDDQLANLVRFSSTLLAKDKRGWLLNPLSVALDAGLSGGAVSCVSIHVGEIRPGGMRGNHRHYTCNETFLLWGARMKFRLENHQLADKGYAEVIIGAEEVAVSGSPSGTAHAIVNIDPQGRLEMAKQCKKMAVFAGCTYVGTEVELRGPINDVTRVHDLLVLRFGFDSSDIEFMTDARGSTVMPTGANIKAALDKMIKKAQDGDVLFFHFSGHGTRIPKADDVGEDEAIVPCDFNLIFDEDFRELLTCLPSGASFTFLSDSCHSGALIDKEKEQIWMRCPMPSPRRPRASQIQGTYAPPPPAPPRLHLCGSTVYRKPCPPPPPPPLPHARNAKNIAPAPSPVSIAAASAAAAAEAAAAAAFSATNVKSAASVGNNAEFAALAAAAFAAATAASAAASAASAAASAASAAASAASAAASAAAACVAAIAAFKGDFRYSALTPTLSCQGTLPPTPPPLPIYGHTKLFVPTPPPPPPPLPRHGVRRYCAPIPAPAPPPLPRCGITKYYLPIPTPVPPPLPRRGNTKYYTPSPPPPPPPRPCCGIDKFIAPTLTHSPPMAFSRSCKVKFIPHDILLQLMKSATHQDASNVADLLLTQFGESASIKIRRPSAETGQYQKLHPDTGILITGCTVNDFSVDVSDGAVAFGPLSNAFQQVLQQIRVLPVYNGELSMFVRETLKREGFTQQLCLYCSEDNTDVIFLG